MVNFDLFDVSDHRFDKFGNLVGVDKPKDLSNDEWLKLEIRNFKDKVNRITAFQEQYAIFLRQTLRNSEIDNISALLKGMEKAVKDKDKSDFWMDILLMLFSTVFMSFVKVLGEKLVKQIADQILENRQKFEVLIVLETQASKIIESKAITQTAIGEIDAFLVKESAKGLVRKAAEKTSADTFSTFVDKSRQELYRLAKQVKKDAQPKFNGYFEAMRTAIQNEELALPFMRVKSRAYSDLMVDLAITMETKYVTRRIGLLRAAAPYTIEENENLFSFGFQKATKGMFIGYGISTARLMVQKNAYLLGGKPIPISAALAKTSPLLRAFLNSLERGDYQSFNFLNATHALELAKLIPVLKDVSVGGKTGHPLFRLKEGTYLSDYFALNVDDALAMILDSNNAFAKWYLYASTLSANSGKYLEHRSIASDYQEHKILSSANPALEKKAQKAKEEIQTFFTEKYLPDVAEELLRPVLLQYIKSLESNKKEMGSLDWVKEALKP